MIRVLIADDHALVRAGIRALLERMPGIEVVAEAGDGAEARQLIPRHRPHVVLMDITMPGLNGLDATVRIAKECELERLTSRQREILQLIAEGRSTKQIAERLGIGVRTVETHRAELMERLDIHDVAGLVRLAITAGLVPPAR